MTPFLPDTAIANIHRVRKKNGTNNILSITLTKFNKFSQFLAQFMLTCQLTKKNIKSTITTCTTLRNNDVSLTSSKCHFHEKINTSSSSYRGIPGNRNATVHFAATVASKFARFISGWLQRVEHPAREGVQNTHHWFWWPQTSHQNWVGQAGSRRRCCSCASVASTSFSLCEGGWWSFRALLLILTFEQLSADIPVWFSCCQLWRCAF